MAGEGDEKKMRKWILSKDSKEIEKVTLWRSGEKAFQVEEGASEEPWGGSGLGMFKEQRDFHCEWNKKSLEGFESILLSSNNVTLTAGWRLDWIMG